MYELINTDYLMEMSEGDSVFICTIIEHYKNEVPDILNNLISACELKEKELVAKLLHKLKSSYLIVGMKELIEHDELLFKEDVTMYDMHIITSEANKIEQRFNMSVQELDLFVEKLNA